MASASNTRRRHSVTSARCVTGIVGVVGILLLCGSKVAIANPSGIDVDQIECNFDASAQVFRPIITIFRFQDSELDPQNKATVRVDLFQGSTQLGVRTTGLLNDDGTIQPNGAYPVPLGESRRFTTQASAPLGDAGTGGPLTPGAIYIIRARAFDVANDEVRVSKNCTAGQSPDAWFLPIESAYRSYIDIADPMHACARRDASWTAETRITYLNDPDHRACYEALQSAVQSPPPGAGESLGYYRQVLNIVCGAARSTPDYRCDHFADTYTAFSWADDWVYVVFNGYLVLDDEMSDPNLLARVSALAGPTLEGLRDVCDALSPPIWLVPLAGAIGTPSALCAPLQELFESGDVGTLGAGASHFPNELDPQFKKRSAELLNLLPPAEQRASAAAELCSIRRQQEDLFEFAVKPGFDDVEESGLISPAARDLAKSIVPVAAGLFRDENFGEILNDKFDLDGAPAYLEYWKLCGGGVRDLIPLVPIIVNEVERFVRIIFPFHFFPFFPVDFFLFSDPQYVRTVQASDDGSVEVELAVPDGHHVLEARGRGADGELLTLGVEFTISSGEGVSGKKLAVRDNADPTRRTVVGLSKDSSISVGGGDGSTDDPTLHGGSLRLQATAGGFDATYPLPATGWRAIGDTPNTGYKYTDRGAVNGPVKKALLKPGPDGAIAKFVLKGSSEITVPTDPVSVVASLMLGGKQHCLTFGGEISFTPGTRWVAKNSPEVACP
jgi:hypothetical protein